jgi:hypothetical protein
MSYGSKRTDPPRRTPTPAVNSAPRQGHIPRADNNNTLPTLQQADFYQRVFAHWLTQASRAPDTRDLWALLDTSNYAHLWYAMRDSGEMLRAWSLSWLSTNQRQAGGTHPDPRLGAHQVPFSARAILHTAATNILGIPIWPVPDTDALANEADLLHEATMPATPKPVCWIVAIPGGSAPAIAVRITATAHPEHAEHAEHPEHTEQQQAHTLFDIAQLLGVIAREHDLLADPDFPGGIILLPPDTAMRALLHQFAIALLGLPRDCPPSWPCACNAIRARYNAAPPSHEQPTEILSLDDLRTHRSPHGGHSSGNRDSDDPQPPAPGEQGDN